MRGRILSFLAVVFIVDAVVLAAGQNAANTAFDVASVKHVKREIPLQKPLNCAFPARGRFSGFGDLRFLIACAFRIPPARARLEILGLPSWADEEVFEIDARSPAADISNFTVAAGLTMLRSLLAERFKLDAGYESKTLPSYTLVVARRDGRLGPSLTPAAADCLAWLSGGRRGAPPTMRGGLPCGRQTVEAHAILATAMTLSQFANLLSPRVDRSIVDHTGLTGAYALELHWAPEPQPGTVEPADGLPTSLFTALQEQLGLKLDPGTTTADILIVNRVDHPSEN